MDINEEINKLEQELQQEHKYAASSSSSDANINEEVRFDSNRINTEQAMGNETRVKGTDWLKEIIVNESDVTMNQTVNCMDVTNNSLSESMFGLNSTTSNLFLNENDIKRKKMKLVK